MSKDKGPHARPFEFEGWFKDAVKGFCGEFERGPWGRHHDGEAEAEHEKGGFGRGPWGRRHSEKDAEWEKMAHEWQSHFMKLQREQLVFVRNMIDSAIEHLDKKSQKA